MNLVRWLLALGAAAFAAVAVPLAGYGQAYPIRPIKLVVPWPAGGVADLRARVIAQRLGKALGEQIVVDNRPGASAVLGAHLVSRAAPDGHMLFGSFIDQGTVLSLMRDLPYDPERDFTYVAPTGRTCLVLVTHIPSATEAGYPDVGITTWGGIRAPAGTPATVVQMLNREINRILASPDVRGHVAFAGAEPDIWTPEEFAQDARKERPRWAQIVKASGIAPQ